MITADQLVVHAIGDYLLQSDWMANGKTQRLTPAVVHATVYSLCFLVFEPSFTAFMTIWWTHLVIDHYRLARYVVWAKNHLAPHRKLCDYTLPIQIELSIGHASECFGRVEPWGDCCATGSPSARPPFLAVWLLIIADNILHVLINGAALAWL